MIFFINYLTLRQAVTPDRLLGRVTATMICLTVSTAPLGGLAGGWVAEHCGLRAAMLLAGVGALLLAPLVTWLSPLARMRELPGPQEPVGDRERGRGDGRGLTAPSGSAVAQGVLDVVVDVPLLRSCCMAVVGGGEVASRPRAGEAARRAWACRPATLAVVIGQTLHSAWATWRVLGGGAAGGAGRRRTGRRAVSWRFSWDGYDAILRPDPRPVDRIRARGTKGPFRPAGVRVLGTMIMLAALALGEWHANER